MIQDLRRNREIFLVILLLFFVLGIRLPFILGGVFGSDAQYHARAALTILNGRRLYVDVPFTYPPLYPYTEALSIALLGDTQLGWKTVSQIYDFGSIAMIWLIARKSFGSRKGFLSALVYGLSPLPLIASSRYVSFDSTACFWMLISIFFLLKQREVPSALALGIGTAYKYFPIVLLIPAITYLPRNRSKLSYLIVTVATTALIQVPFIVTDFSAWYNNVISFHLLRDGEGYTIYGLLSNHPQLWSVPQSPLMLLQPIALFLTYFLVYIDEDRTDLGLFKKMALVMIVTVFFSKVVLFYALWFIPIFAIFILLSTTKSKLFGLAAFIILQMAPLLGLYFYESGRLQESIYLGYPYLLACASLIAWLLWDRLRFVSRHHQA